MNKKDERKKLIDSLRIPIIFLLIIWILKTFELVFNLDFSGFGIYPRTLKGLKGILFAPFLHSDLNHLWANSVAFLILSSFTFYFYKIVAFRLFLLSFFISGLCVWIGGREGHHIGASGLVYVFAAFLTISGFISRNYRLVAISLIVIFLYGSLIWGIFPIDPEISWEGHLFGGLTGFALAIFYRKYSPKRQQFKWEKDRSGDEHYIVYSYKAPKPKKPSLVEMLKKTRDKNLEKRIKK